MGIAIIKAMTMKIPQVQVGIQVANRTPIAIPPMTLAVTYNNARELGKLCSFSIFSPTQLMMLTS